MRGRSPPPIVPEMSSTDEPTVEPGIASDGNEPTDATGTQSEPRLDGGERRSLPERTFGAPLVPDCS